MKRSLILVLVVFFLACNAAAQNNNEAQLAQGASMPDKPVLSSCAEDRQELTSELGQLKVLADQMRTNLGFVQLSPTPLKHQFELQADAWQLIVKQLERRLEKIECSDGSDKLPKK